jgi:hypothetical protein
MLARPRSARRFSAVAKPANFAQDYAPCNSKGLIESRFIDIVRAKLAK